MAIEYSLRCDDCGATITTSRLSVRDARARAQLRCGANCGGGVDRCAGCREKRNQLPTGDALKGTHSISTNPPRGDDWDRPVSPLAMKDD